MHGVCQGVREKFGYFADYSYLCTPNAIQISFRPDLNSPLAG